MMNSASQDIVSQGSDLSESTQTKEDDTSVNAADLPDSSLFAFAAPSPDSLKSQPNSKLEERANAHAMTGLRLIEQRDFPQANQSLRSAYFLFHYLKNWLKVACVIHQLGVSYREQGHHDQAFTLIKKASRIFLANATNLPRHDCYANTVFDLNLGLHQQHLYAEALDLLECARPHLPQWSILDRCRFDYNIALSQFKLGQLASAAVMFARALSLLVPHVRSKGWKAPRSVITFLGNCHLNLAESLRMLVDEEGGSWGAAQEKLIAARQEIDHTGPQMETERATRMEERTGRALCTATERNYFRAIRLHLPRKQDTVDDSLAAENLFIFALHSLVILLHRTHQAQKSVLLLSMVKRLPWVKGEICGSTQQSPPSSYFVAPAHSEPCFCSSSVPINRARKQRFNELFFKWERSLVTLQHKLRILEERQGGKTH
eukprot:gb/GEZN01004159.1/.p1 GENE.gb/GEZN01004159.1/~~gb/GEZN01004159.1/.p1  ORF type:complete len:432 (+),score=46.92 gb/GEZN01004159.1/:169-1464(+)